MMYAGRGSDLRVIVRAVRQILRQAQNDGGRAGGRPGGRARLLLSRLSHGGRSSAERTFSYILQRQWDYAGAAMTFLGSQSL